MRSWIRWGDTREDECVIRRECTPFLSLSFIFPQHLSCIPLSVLPSLVPSFQCAVCVEICICGDSMTGETLCSALSINPSICLHDNQSVLSFLLDNQVIQAITQALKNEYHSMPSTQNSSQFLPYWNRSILGSLQQGTLSCRFLKDAMCMYT